jgi:hypothetical protein
MTLAALGAERHLDRVSQHIDAAQHARTSIGVELDVFGSHGCQASLLGLLSAIFWLTPPCWLRSCLR